jgi:TetR/AcrR family transcriptional repressor of nem operon
MKSYGGRMARTGRPRAFDVDDTVARARDLFWSRGYAATSVQDLVDGLSVQRGSLYAAFGDKRGLYLNAVSLYARENREVLQAALADGPVLPTLRRILTAPEELTGTGPSGEQRLGCLIGNTTAELVPADETAHTLVAAAYEAFVDVVAASLRRAQDEGEVTTRSTPTAQAQMVLLLFQGSALVNRAGNGNTHHNAGIEAALDGLRRQ